MIDPQQSTGWLNLAVAQVRISQLSRHFQNLYLPKQGILCFASGFLWSSTRKAHVLKTELVVSDNELGEYDSQVASRLAATRWVDVAVIHLWFLVAGQVVDHQRHKSQTQKHSPPGLWVFL